MATEQLTTSTPAKRRWGRGQRPETAEAPAQAVQEPALEQRSAAAATGGAVASSSATASAGDEHPAQRQQSSGLYLPSGEAYFPLMSEAEVAAISVPAGAPADVIQGVLQRHGTCLVLGVLSPEECASCERLWSKDLLDLVAEAPRDRGGAAATALLQRLRTEGCSAWPSAWDFIGKKGMGSQRGVPHGSFAWRTRLHEGVRKVFADLFDVPSSELAVGLDNVFWSPMGSEVLDSNEEWLHVDQNHCTGLRWQCYQSALYIWPSVSEEASTTVVWPRSHLQVYDQIMNDQAARRGRGQSVRLSNLANKMLRARLSEQAVAGSRRVPCPAGSLLLWDSKTVHQGWRSGPRLAMPICWEPRSRREGNRGALRRKVFMTAAGVPSSHSSAEGRVHGMATRRVPRPFNAWVENAQVQVRAQLVPYGIAEGRREEWVARGIQSLLWGGDEDPRSNAELVDEQRLAPLLRPEVLAAL